MKKPMAWTDDRVATKEASKEKFHSSFKPWIRVAAFVVAVIFLPEQVAQAVEYDWRVIWNKPVISVPLTGSFTPAQLKNVQNAAIPQAVRSILKDIANKPITSIKIADNLTIELDKPLKMSNQRIEELYNWLQGKPCGAKALYDYLSYKGAKVEEQDIAVFALTIDILNGIVKPEGNPEVIKNSLYALSKASEFFGNKLYAAKLSELSSELAPFIAHLNGDHYVLVTKVSDEKVYFLDEHKEEFLPIEKFLKDFSGYALIPQLSAKGALSLPDAEAKKILGARSNRNGYTDLSALFAEPKSSDLWLGLGLTAVSCAFSAYVGNTNFITAFGQAAFYSQVGQAATNVGVRNLGMSPTSAQIFGYAVTGALAGATSAYTAGKPTYKFSDGWGSVGATMNNNPVFSGAAIGALKGAAMAGSSVLAYNAVKDTGFYKQNPYIARQLGSLFGGAVGYVGFSGLTSAIGINSTMANYNPATNKAEAIKINVDGKTIPYESVSDYASKMGWTASSDQTWSDMSISNRFGAGVMAAIRDPAFQGNFTSQSASLVAEYAATQGWLGGDLKKHPSYAGLLGQSFNHLINTDYNNPKQTTSQIVLGAVTKGLVTGGVSVGLNYLGGDYDTTTGKNKMGLSNLEMAGLTWLGSAALYSTTGTLITANQSTKELAADQSWLGFDGELFKRRFQEFNKDYLTLGGTSPIYTKGAGGWSESMYIEKLAQLGGYANFTANADYAMKQKGYTDFGKFVDDGNLSSLTPSLAYSLVNYAQSSLHYAAAENLSSLGKDLIYPILFPTTISGDKLGVSASLKAKLQPTVLWGDAKLASYWNDKDIVKDVVEYKSSFRDEKPTDKPVYTDKDRDFIKDSSKLIINNDKSVSLKFLLPKTESYTINSDAKPVNNYTEKQVSQPSLSEGMGNGVDVTVKPVTSEVNLMSGTLGMLLHNNSGQLNLDFNTVNYSAGAKWQVPKFNIIGKDNIGQAYYADKYSGVRFDSDRYLGHLAGQSGKVTIGYGNFLGEGAFIKDLLPPGHSMTVNGIRDANGLETDIILNRLDYLYEFDKTGKTSLNAKLSYAAGSYEQRLRPQDQNYNKTPVISPDFSLASIDSMNDTGVSPSASIVRAIESRRDQIMQQTLAATKIEAVAKGYIYDLDSFNGNPVLLTEGELLVPAQKSSQTEKGSIPEVTKVELTYKGLAEGNIIEGTDRRLPINKAEGYGGLVANLDEQGIQGLDASSFNLAKGARWTDVAVDSYSKDKSSINVSGVNRLVSSYGVGPEASVTFTSLGIQPGSELKYLEIGKNSSELHQTYLKGMGKDVELNVFKYNPGLKENIVNSFLEGKAAAINDIKSESSKMPGQLKPGVISQIENVKTGKELVSFLEKGIKYNVTSWAEYRINGELPAEQAIFGKGIEHNLGWKVDGGESSSSRLASQFRMTDPDGKYTAIQQWEGPAPFIPSGVLNPTKVNVNEEIKLVEKNAPVLSGTFNYQLYTLKGNVGPVYFSKSGILTGIGFDKEGKFNFSVVTEAKGIGYTGARVAIEENGQVKAGFKFDDGIALLNNLVINYNGNPKDAGISSVGLNWIGKSHKDGIGQISEHFWAKPKVEFFEPGQNENARVKSMIQGKVGTDAVAHIVDSFGRYDVQEDNKWVAPQEKILFNKELQERHSILWELAGKGIVPETGTASLVAQLPTNKGLAFLAQGLPVMNAAMRGGKSDTTEQDPIVLGVKHTVNVGGKKGAIIQPKSDSSVPVIIAQGKNDNLEYQVITQAQGLAYSTPKGVKIPWSLNVDEKKGAASLTYLKAGKTSGLIEFPDGKPMKNQMSQNSYSLKTGEEGYFMKQKSGEDKFTTRSEFKKQLAGNLAELKSAFAKAKLDSALIINAEKLLKQGNLFKANDVLAKASQQYNQYVEKAKKELEAKTFKIVNGLRGIKDENGSIQWINEKGELHSVSFKVPGGYYNVLKENIKENNDKQIESIKINGKDYALTKNGIMLLSELNKNQEYLKAKTVAIKNGL
jgi:hypothetical protein